MYNFFAADIIKNFTGVLIMKAVCIHEFGNVDVVKIEDKAIPTIQDQQDILVEVHAAGVNPIDWKIREGYFADDTENFFPFPMGWDFSGKIISIGNSVSQFKPGDEVYGLIRFYEPAGTFAEYVTAPSTQVCLKPHHYDHVHAAATPLVALTAWQALFELANLQKNQTVLVHAAGGGVGQFAVQLAKWKGAKVIAVASHASSTLLTAFGVDQFIDYKKEKFEDNIQNVDIALNLVGDKDTALRSLKVMKPGGKIISFLGPHDPEVIAKAQEKNIEALSMIVKPNGKQLAAITQLINDKLIQTTIEKTFPLEEVKAALNLVQAGHCHGKVVLKVK